ncbi:hypothetical protein ACFYUV_38225 [Nonomuraea sp. NPDC003560]|uniref:hypothetical protein n=1 Tax=Nonomuraea sp. NPDC003560 TaxID=3364341 RepID=UPI00368B49E4
MNAPRCPHSSADPRMCPDCRTERLSGQPVPPLRAVVAVLAEQPAQMLDEDHADYTEVLKAEMRHVLDRVDWAGLPKGDLRALLRSALYGVPPHTDVIIRASEALAEEPQLYLVSGNGIPLEQQGSDHGEGNSTPVE